MLSQFDALPEQATKIVGADDFGWSDYVEPMKILLKDFDRGYFGVVGMQMASGNIVGLLVSQRSVAR